MRVLHLSSYDIQGGAALAAHRLHRGLRATGVDSRMWVRRRFGTDPHVACASSPWAALLARWRRRRELWLARRGGWSGDMRFSPGIAGAALRPVVARFAPDVVHLHWVNDGFVAVRDLAGLACPVVWTVHDMWPFTGGCHYAGACERYRDRCGACPALGARAEEDLSRVMFVRKQEVFDRLRLALACPSGWMADRAAASALFRNRTVRVVPNGVDLDVFHPGGRDAARARLGLPRDGLLVMGGASRFREDRRKGFDLFSALVRALREGGRLGDLHVAVFGTGRPGVVNQDGLTITELGEISGESGLTAVYQAADLFVAPSREDNLPNTLLEAMGCGTPCASFAIGGIPEIIRDGVDGCLAPAFDIPALAERAAALLGDADRLAAARFAARASMERRFSLAGSVAAYRELYGELRGAA